jgi:MFS transporter, PPP family, 3-phenylpropionic acid transporter
MTGGVAPAAAPDLRRLRGLYAALGAGIGSLLPYLVLYLRSRGMSPTQAGLVLGLMSAVGVLAVPAWGLLADRVVGTVTAMRTSCALAALAALALLAAGGSVPAIFVCAAALAAVRAPSEALADTLAVSTLGTAAGRLYGSIRLWSSTGFAAAVALWALVLQHTTLALVLVAFPAAMLVQLASTVGHRWPAARSGRLTHLEGLRGLRHSRLPLLLGGALAYGMAMGASWTVLPLRLTDVGGGVLAVGAAAFVGALAEIPFMRSSGALRQRLGAGNVFVAGGAVFGTALLLYGLLTDPALLVASSVLRGAGYGLVYVGFVTATGTLVPRQLLATSQALLQMTLMGLAPVVGASAGGFIYQHGSPTALFCAAAAAALTGAAMARRAATARPSSDRAQDARTSST